MKIDTANKNIFGVIALFLLALFLNTSCSGREYPYRAKLTVQVVDEEGRPVDNAKIQIVPLGLQGDPRFYERTDANGFYTREFRNNSVRIFYDYRFIYQYKDVENRKYVPWNPTVKVTLNRIKKPIPMYAKRMEITLPVMEEPVGFDLVAADWVQPYGKGWVSDFIFTGSKEIQDLWNYSLYLSLGH